MVKILDTRERESIYDPDCGTGGMLLRAINHARECEGFGRPRRSRRQELLEYYG